MRLEIEETALKKEKDKASKERLEVLKRELADLKAEADAMRRHLEGEAPEESPMAPPSAAPDSGCCGGGSCG